VLARRRREGRGDGVAQPADMKAIFNVRRGTKEGRNGPQEQCKK